MWVLGWVREVTIRNVAGFEEVEPFYWRVNGNTAMEIKCVISAFCDGFLKSEAMITPLERNEIMHIKAKA